jgi:GrpB-like predicted nucleotidyltransferase (UPF0157 family)
VTICAPRREWASDFKTLAQQLGHALGPLAFRIDHIGSTAVPGLPAKDVIDAQVIVGSLEPRQPIIDGFKAAGFVPRAGEWNLRDHVPTMSKGTPSGWDKMTFGPHGRERPSNVHVRVLGSPNERYALLFRDFLRANDAARSNWGEFKVRLAAAVPDLTTYGQAKDPATDVLMLAAEGWAAATQWEC